MGETYPAACCSTMLVAIVVVVWSAYGILDATTSDLEECPRTLTCENEMLPGGGIDLKYSMSPWSIGGRDCNWFAQDTTRCALPALFSEASNICFDFAYWKDSRDWSCINWTHYVTGTDAMWSPRTDGFDARCNTSPPNSNMSAFELNAMKSACCVCGGGLVGRDYAGPASAPDKNFEQPKPVTVPEQHKGKPPHHLTQCCVCNVTAVQRGIAGKSEAQTKEILDNKRKAINPRPGKLSCPITMEKYFDKRRDLLDPYIIGASVVTALLLCLVVGCCWCGREESAVMRDGKSSEPLILRL